MSAELEVQEDRDYGHGVIGRLLVGDDGKLHGFEYDHPRPDGQPGWRPGGTCAGYAPINAEGTHWDLVQIEPLTLSPSLLCRACGHHGFVRDGRWVPA